MWDKREDEMNERWKERWEKEWDERKREMKRARDEEDECWTKYLMIDRNSYCIKKKII